MNKTVPAFAPGTCDSDFSPLFVDVDRFKVRDDTYSRQEGDNALAAVTRRIGEKIRRPFDTAARYGGE
ncbi:TPA: diguanylate cyclase [Burkholderia aenigmatica]|nr:diguanylate cyclase [Burkholderia aenigmatica]HDR9517070.1 diguanylate cyclase [Burkholderia aenigmatica]HDR9594851.1 diguanylate cyclase [Burkholderia aenigmatica]HDR9600164.1 diguanylate cyclase [Burkholderia aenigmatica]HDR9612920.1 diguanylate cyclase [Burkholderia aenigmatica]